MNPSAHQVPTLNTKAKAQEHSVKMANQQGNVRGKIQGMDTKVSDLGILLEGVGLTIRARKGVLSNDLPSGSAVALQQVHVDRDNVKGLERQLDTSEVELATQRVEMADAMASASKAFEQAKEAIAEMDDMMARNQHTGLEMVKYHPMALPYMEKLVAEAKENGVFPDNAGVPCTFSHVGSGTGIQPRLQDPTMKSQKELQETVDRLDRQVMDLVQEVSAAHDRRRSDKKGHDKALATMTKLLEESMLREKELRLEVDALKSLRHKADAQRRMHLETIDTLTEEKETAATERDEWAHKYDVKAKEAERRGETIDKAAILLEDANERAATIKSRYSQHLVTMGRSATGMDCRVGQWDNFVSLLEQESVAVNTQSVAAEWELLVPWGSTNEPLPTWEGSLEKAYLTLWAKLANRDAVSLETFVVVHQFVQRVKSTGRVHEAATKRLLRWASTRMAATPLLDTSQKLAALAWWLLAEFVGSQDLECPNSMGDLYRELQAALVKGKIEEFCRKNDGFGSDDKVFVRWDGAWHLMVDTSRKTLCWVHCTRLDLGGVGRVVIASPPGIDDVVVSTASGDDEFWWMR